MLQNLTQNKSLLVAASALVVLGLVLILIVGLRGASSNQSAPTPTVNISDVQTAAVATFAYGLTQTAVLEPTATLTDTPIPTNTLLTFNAGGTPSSAGLGASPTVSCYRLVYIKDVTVPDHTIMTPGQTFTKTWEVGNTGGCAWQVGFKFSLVGGDALGASTLSLTQSVQSGTNYQISVPMVAPPNRNGTIIGSWRMSDLNGNFFGDTLTVVIDMGTGTTTVTSTTGASTATATSTTAPPTATSTP